MTENVDYLVSFAQVPGFEISEEVWQQGAVLHAHVHEGPHMVVVFDGGFREHEVTGSRAVGSATILYFPPGLCHAVEFKERTTLLSIEVNGARAAMAKALFANVPAGTPVASTELFALSLRIRDELRNKRRSSDVVLEALALEFLALTSRLLETRLAPRVAPYLQEARRLINEQYMKKLRVIDIAGTLGVSAVSLAEGFRRAFDCSVGDYIRRKRVEHAIEMLIATESPLGEIAIGAGFCDQSHFVRVFKAQTGMTPSMYRRNHASKAS